MARLHRRRGEWGAARQIWEGLSEKGDAEAIEALAKFLEHGARNYRAALSLAQRLPPGPGRELRCRRLQIKLMPQGG